MMMNNQNPPRLFKQQIPKSVLRSLLPGLTILLVLLFVLAGTLLLHQQQEWQNQRTDRIARMIQVDLERLLDLQAQGMNMTLQAIIRDERARQGLKNGDRKRLLAEWKPLYETLLKEQGLTHFYFSDVKRVCLLRLHMPEKHGDRFDRFTILEAERTGKTASGIELGPLGTFTLRAVAPVFDGSTLLGYVELGKEIEDVLDAIHIAMPGVDLAVAIHKDALKRETWESGMRMLGREANWDRLPHRVIIYASQGRLPDVFEPFVDPGKDPVDGYEHGATDWEVTGDNKVWRVTTLPLRDVSGTEKGDLLIMNDMTELKATFNRSVVLGGGIGAVLFVSLLALVFVMLRRTDEGIRAQQAEITKSRSLLSATLESTADGLLVINTDGIRSLYNQRFIEMWHVPQDILKDNADEAFLQYVIGQMANPEDFLAKVRELYDAPEVSSVDILHLADGRVFERHSHPQRQGEKVIGRVWSFRDITERKRTDLQLKQQKAQLEQRNRALKQFNYAVSHELKTPLVSIESSLGLIQSSLPQTMDSELNTAFGYARHATRQMNNLLESLLLMFRIDAADTDTETTAFGVLVQDAIDQLTRENRLKGIKVTIPVEGPELCGDRHKLVQICLQLIENAAKYMGDQKDPAIAIGFEQTDEEVQFYVRDNGMGIEQPYQGNIFGLFDQLDKTAGGTGLGLTLVQRIVEYYGGTIRVESEGLGKGSCFYFTLPDVLITKDTTT